MAIDNSSNVGFDVVNATADLTLNPLEPLISDHAVIIFQYVCYCTVNQIIDVFGTVTNVINILCFLKQGFKDRVNVSLFGLALSDLGCLVTLIWLNASMTPAFLQQELTFEQLDIQYLTASWPHVVFTRISSCITVFITLERCLCITLPLKVKMIFTSKRVTIIIVSSFVIFILSVSPVYCVNIYTNVFSSDRNTTLMAISRTENHACVEQVVLTLSVVAEFFMYVSVSVCTAILTSKLQRKTKWRQSIATVNSDSVQIRDQRVAKMIVIISTVFIISYTPNCGTLLGMAIEPELAINGKHKNILIFIFGFGVVLESINASVNIIIYYNMSSRYRTTFRQIFGLSKTETSDQLLTTLHLYVKG